MNKSPTPHSGLLADRRAAENPSAHCVSDGTHALDNAAFAAAVRHLAGRMADLGITRGDVVAVLLPNCVELVATMFAAWRLGAALTPVNPALTMSEVTYQLTDSGAALLVTDAETADQVTSTRTLDAAVVVPADPESVPNDQSAEPPGADGDTALIIYTSGTTGKPKGVLLDHANLHAMSGSIVEHLRLGPDDRSLLVLPLFHANGLIVGVLSVLRAGGDVVIAPRFRPDEFWGHVETQRPTYFSAVPTIYAKLDALPDDVVPDTSSLRFAICGAAPMSADLIERFENRYGVAVIEGYGLSEGTVASVINPVDGKRKPGTVGLPITGQTVQVVDPHGNRLPPGERGEVVIAGPNIMRGYLGRQEETAKTVRDGWLHTGDVGVFDADGYLTIVDRLKDMIIRGGENIYPKEIEDALYAHPAVLEAAVIGAPDEIFGERPVAFASLRPEHGNVGPDTLIEHCRTLLAPFKVPHSVRILPELPKNSVGKITKLALQESVHKGRP